ncbi:MAG: DUF6572 domain-containing protein [Pseudomonadota bacterium]
MAINKTDVIDAIGTDIDTGMVVLSLICAEEMTPEALLLVQEKLNSYLTFIESGEIYSSYPSAKGKDLHIRIYSQFRPQGMAAEFLALAEPIVTGAGIGFSYGPGGSGYVDDMS